GGREVLAEVEEELGKLHLGEEGVRQLARRRGRPAGRRRHRRGLALRRRRQARELWQERRQRLVDAVTRRSIVAQGRLNARLGLERDGDALVERQDSPRDRGPLCGRLRHGLRRRRLRESASGREQEEGRYDSDNRCDRDSNKHERFHWPREYHGGEE